MFDCGRYKFLLAIKEQTVCCTKGYIEHSAVCSKHNHIHTHGERQALLLDTDRFVRVNCFTEMLFHNAVTTMDFMNVRKITEKLQNKYFTGVYVLLFNL